MATLEDLKLTRSSFPTVGDNGASHLAQLGQQLPVASSGAAKAAGLPVKNSVPNIIVRYGPPIQILIDGTPVVRKVAGGGGGFHGGRR